MHFFFLICFPSFLRGRLALQEYHQYLRQGCSNDNDKQLLVPSASSARNRSSGILLQRIYGHVSHNAGSEALVASSTMPPDIYDNSVECQCGQASAQLFDSAGVRGICILFHYVLTYFVLFCLWVFFHSLHFYVWGHFLLTTRSVLTERQLTNQGRVDVQLFPPFNLSGSPAESSVIKSILRSSILGVETSW